MLEYIVVQVISLQIRHHSWQQVTVLQQELDTECWLETTDYRVVDVVPDFDDGGHFDWTVLFALE